MEALEREVRPGVIRFGVINMWIVRETKAKNRPLRKCDSQSTETSIFLPLTFSIP